MNPRAHRRTLRARAECRRLVVAGMLDPRGMANQGCIRTRTLASGERRFFLDFRPHGRVFAIQTEAGPIPLVDEKTALELLKAIRKSVTPERSIDQVLASFQRSSSSHVLRRAEAWIEAKAREEHAGDLSTSSLTEMREQVGRYWARWEGISIHDVGRRHLEDWNGELADRGLAPSTRRWLLAYFRAFLRWLENRGELRLVPRFPQVVVPEREPVLLTRVQQDRVLEAIPESQRGLYLVLVDLAVRPSEARPLRASALERVEAPGPEDPPAWLRIDQGAKDKNKAAPVRGTKTNRSKRLPVTDRILAWIDRPGAPSSREPGALLFPSPRGGMYSHSALWKRWRTACAAASVPIVPLYQGTKHSTATHLLRQGASLEALRRLLGHRDAKSTERYARLADQAVVEMMRRPRRG